VRIGVELTLILLAILLNGLFAASENHLVSARISRLAPFGSRELLVVGSQHRSGGDVFRLC
jgi:hypothetical protein